jgi:hypothetical protein
MIMKIAIKAALKGSVERDERSDTETEEEAHDK